MIIRSVKNYWGIHEWESSRAKQIRVTFVDPLFPPEDITLTFTVKNGNPPTSRRLYPVIPRLFHLVHRHYQDRVMYDWQTDMYPNPEKNVEKVQLELKRLQHTLFVIFNRSRWGYHNARKT